MSPTARTALVTGAARGIGRACAARLLADGHTVIAVDLAKSEPILADNDGNPDSVTLTCDVADPTQVKALHAKVTARFGRVDILVNNVGIFPACSLADLDYESFRHVMTVNVDSVFSCRQPSDRHARFWMGAHCQPRFVNHTLTHP